MSKKCIVLFFIPLLAVMLVPQLTLTVFAAVDPNPATSSLSGGLVPNCNPSNTNLAEGGDATSGCGLDDAQQLVYNIISYVSYISITLAVLMFGYAGFMIMTAAGSSEKINQARGIFTKVGIGLLIIFGSTLIVRYVFKAVDFDADYGPANLDLNSLDAN